MNPWVHRANLLGFHNMPLATPLISQAVNAVLRQRRNLASTIFCTTTVGFLLLRREEP
jgi:uncharacterized membrane protein